MGLRGAGGMKSFLQFGLSFEDIKIVDLSTYHSCRFTNSLSSWEMGLIICNFLIKYLQDFRKKSKETDCPDQLYLETQRYLFKSTL